MFRWFLVRGCVLAAVLVAGCSGGGANVGGEVRDGDGPWWPDHGRLPDPGNHADVGDAVEGAGWDWGEGRGPADGDGGGWRDGEVFDFGGGGDATGECGKDSDCEGKAPGLPPCMKPVCDKHQGVCVAGPRSVGEPCDDGDACTRDTVCTVGGACLGMPVFCDDFNLCSTDACAPDKGCIYQPNDNTCDDGNGCTINDRCENGKCAGEETDDCQCQDDGDCKTEDDGDSCNGLLKCVFGKCKVPQSTLVYCDTSADTPCRKTTCDPATGKCVQVVRENGRPCDDGDACTDGDLCLMAECIGSAPRSCDDSNGCTIDTCDPKYGCHNEFSSYPCDDGDNCTVNDHCVLGQCQPGSSNSCPGATCYPKWTLGCGTADAWTTDGQGTSDNVEEYSCGGGKMPGAEFTYSFVAPYDGTATVLLEGDPVSLQVAVLESRGSGCDPANCRGATPGLLTFDMYAGATYYFVVDGVLSEGQEYKISLDCTPGVELLCGDDADNDKDGEMDCADPDCAASADCPPPRCLPVWTLACGSQDFGANYGLGATSAIATYASVPENKGCLDNQWEYSGPEFAYRFDAPGSFEVTVRLTDESAQTDLLILRDQGHGCEPTDCVAWGMKKVTFPAKAGETYYLVVDGYAGAEGSFNIALECPLFVETNCSDDEDNDQDELVDCQDEDCVGSVDCIGHCHAARTIECGHKEAFANFGWGSTDAVLKYECKKQYVYPGPEMAYRFVAPYDAAVKASLLLETESTDIALLDGEECDPEKCLAVGLDNVAFDALKGKVYSLVVDGWQGALGTYLLKLECTPETEVVCGDGQDNDGDGQTDCADEADCHVSPDCPKCSSVYPIACGDADEFNTGNDEATDKIRAYSCHQALYDGPEFAYTFEPDQSGQVTLTLTSSGWDLDLFVLQDKGYGCNPGNCIAWGTGSAAFQAEKGIKYHVVVDGYGKALAGFGPDFGIGEYVLTVACAQ